MEQLTEIYLLSETRSFLNVELFLDKFIPCPMQQAADYPFPQYSENPIRIYTDSFELMKLLEFKTNESYSIYFCSAKGDSKQGVISYTSDGGILFGIFRPYAHVTVPKGAVELMLEAGKLVGGEYGIITGEFPPLDTAKEFTELCSETKTNAALVNGSLNKIAKAKY